MNPCNIVQDLLPLYADNTCSPGTREFVEEHIADCPACKALLESMKQSIDVDLPKQNARANFRSFSRRAARKRVFAITLYILLGLAGLIIALWHPLIKPYFFHTQYFSLNDIDAQFSRLSDGSVYARFTYTGDEHTMGGSGVEHGSEGEYVMSFQYPRFHDLILPADPGYTREIIFPTAESEYIDWHTMAPAVSFTLIGAEGERILWQEGDELPPANAEAEALLKERIKSGEFIPVEEWREKIESGEIEFG